MQFWYFLAINSKIENELETLSCQHHYLPAWLCIDAYHWIMQRRKVFTHFPFFLFPFLFVWKPKCWLMRWCWDKKGAICFPERSPREQFVAGKLPDFTQDLSQRSFTFPRHLNIWPDIWTDFLDVWCVVSWQPWVPQHYLFGTTSEVDKMIRTLARFSTTIYKE